MTIAESILKDLRMADSLQRLGRTHEFQIVAKSIKNDIEKCCIKKQIVYNQQWVDVCQQCKELNIDTTELEIELSFAQDQQAHKK